MPIKGFDQLNKNLNQLAQNIDDLGQTKSASLTDIFTPKFVSQHTRFVNAEEFFKASGLNMSTQADFEAIPDNQMDSYIRSETSFASWREMLNAAGVAWAKKRIGF